MSRRLLFASLVVGLVAVAVWFNQHARPVTAAATPPPSSVTAAPPPAAPAAPAGAAVASAPDTEPSPPVTQPRPPAQPRLLADIPPGPFRDSLLKLDEPSRQRALAKLSKLNVPREDYASLRAGPGGALLYMCEPPPGAAKGAAKAAVVPANAASASGAAPTVAAAAVPISTPPIRHSKPGSANVLYLDFNGFTITGTYWNTYYGPATYQALPFDTDGNPATFSDSEQAAIVEIWARVSEDYAPFDVDVTTEEPAVFTSTMGRAVITKNTDANGVTMPSSTAGGVAWLDVFGQSDYVSTYSPALIYYNNLGSRAEYIAEATAHELGHNFGLSHDGQTKDPNNAASVAAEYYSGHGSGNTSWAPIMGAPYDRNVTQWSKGEYYLANNTEDDLAIIGGKLGYRTDEAGGTLATTAVTAVTGTAVSASGILSSSSDVDVFAVSAAAGQVSFTVAPYKDAAASTSGGDAFVKFELLDASGAPLVSNTSAVSGTSSNPLNVTLTYIGASATTYYLRITPVGTGTPQVASPTGFTSYASIGQYTVTGTIVPVQPAIVGTLTASVAAGQPFSYAVMATNSPTTYAATGLPSGLSIDAGTGLITGRPTAAGSFSVALTVTNTQGTGNATLALTVTNAPPVITSQTTGRQVVTTGGSLTLSATAISANGTPTYQWKRNGLNLAGATASSLTLSPAVVTDSGYYQLLATNTIGTTASAVVFVRVAPNVSQILGWGSNSTGQLTFPGGLTTVTDLAAGNAHVLALKADGTVVGWGSNTNGQTTIPATLANVVAIATGQDFSVALKVDGTVSAWGRNSSAQGNQTSVPGNLSGVVAISAGAFHTLAVKSDGTVRAWGSNVYNQTTVPAGLATAVAVAAGGFHSLALKSDGTVVGWGLNTNGQTTIPAGLANVVAIAAGDNFSVALKSDGTVVAWGLGTNGQTTVPSGLANVTAIAAGSTHALAVKADGTLTAWGFNASATPVWLDHLAGAKGGTAYSVALRDASADTTPVFAASPQAQSVAYGANATFFVGVTGAPPISYQWQVSTDGGGSWSDLHDGGVYSGTATTTLLVSGATLSLSGLQYHCVAANSLGAATSGAATLTVTRANQTITFSKPSDTVYGSGNLSLSASASSGLPVTISIVSGPAQIVSGAIVATGVGTVTLRAAQPGDTNYNAATSVDQSYAVTPASLTITANAQSRAYGAANPALTLSYSGFVNNETPAVLTSVPLATTTAVATSSVVSGGYPITLSGGSAANYTIVLVPGTLTVTKAPLTITADNQSRAYNTANPTLTLSYSGFANNETATAITVPTVATVAVPTSPVGTYPITLSGGGAANYTLTLVPGTLTVTPASQAITFGALAGKTYGAAAFSLSATADSGLPVSFAYVSGPATVSSGTVTITGAGTVTVRATQAGNASYAAATPVDRSFTVAPATLTVTADSLSRTYGADNPVFTLSYSGFVNNETAAVLISPPTAATTATAASAANTTAPITLSGGSAANYALALVPGTLSIAPAALTVTADNLFRAYGTPNPALTFKYSGFVNNETAAVLTSLPVIATTADLSSPVGTYPITLSGGSAANYTLTRVAGTLTVTSASQTIAFNTPADKVYGAAPFALGATASSGLRVSYTVLSGPATVSGSTLTITGTGPVTVRASQSGDGTYGAATDVDRSFTVAKAPLTITAASLSRVYGAANPTLTLNYSGFAYNETAAVLTELPVAATSATAASPVVGGGYPITLTGGIAANYTLSLVPGVLTLTKASLTAKADNQSRVYNTANPAFTITYTGFVNNDGIGALTTAPTASTNATQTSAAGTYPITVSGGSATNYTITPGSGTLTITKAAATVTLGNLNQTYSSTARTASVTTIPAGLSASYTYDGGSTAPVNAGSYAVVATINDANYTGTASGTLTIAKAVAPVTLGGLSQTYSGGAKSATATTAPANLNVSYTYDGGSASPVNAGSYAVTATVNDANYTGTASGTLTITKATATVTLDSLGATYDGTPKSVTVTTTPASLATTLTYDGGATAPTNAGDHTVVATVNDANYTGAATGTLTIAKAANVITFNPPGGVAALNQPFDVTATASSGLTVAFSVFSGPATLTNGHTVTITGPGTVVIRATQAGDANYLAAASVDLSFIVGKISQSITFAAPTDHTYGDAPFAVGATADSGLAVTLSVVSGPATLANGQLTLTGVGPVTLRATQDGNATYTAATNVERTFNVTKATLTVTADAQTRVYGTDNPALTFKYSGFVYNEGASALTALPAASTTATSASGADTYPITVAGGSAANYAFTYVPGVLTVTKAALTARADDQTRVYGVANPSLTVTYTGFVNNDGIAAITTPPVASTAATLLSPVGAYAITLTGGASANYTFAGTGGTLTITKAAAAVMLGSLGATYDGTAKSATVVTAPAGLATVLTYNGGASAPTDAGDYAVAAAVSDANYQGGAAGTLTIAKAANVITFGALSGVTLGGQPFDVSATASSGLSVAFSVLSGPATLGNGRTVTVTGTGTVTIRATQAGDANHLAASPVDQSFSVGKAAQQITFAAPADHTYGDSPFAVGATSDSALPVTLMVVSGPATLANGQLALTGAGAVTLRASQAGDASFAAATDVDRTFNVAKASLTVTAASQSRVYGSANPTLTVTYAGFVNADNVTAITAPTAATTATDASPVGAYPITLSGGSAANYTFRTVGGVLTVTKAALTATAANQTRIYGAANPALTVTYSGFVNNDTAAAITAPTASTTATTSSAAGTYPITLSGGSAANYTLTLVNGTLTVTRRDYSGTYFGTFASGGHWALYVHSDNTATYLAYLPSRSSAIVVNLTVNAGGTFTVTGTELKASAVATVSALALANPEASVTRSATAASSYTLSGQIGSDGAITGQLGGFGESFTGTADTTTGSAQTSAGYYTASALGTTSSTTYAIVSASGQTLVVTTGASIDSASGTVDASGQLTATTVGSAALTLTINASAQTVAATVTPAGSSTPVVYNGVGSTVTPVARVVNLSVRSQAGTGSQTLIVGAVINGSGNKTLLLRGSGPALVPYGVTNALADPAMRLLDGQRTELATNDNWDNSLLAKFNELGASPFAANSKDAALYQQLSAGVYSVHVYPASTGTGVVLAELYDADTTATGAEVVNVSARTQVGVDDNILILGFVITGNTPKTLLIRGMGPTLIPLGVTDALADPQLYLYQGNTLLGTNDNWGGTTALKTAASTVGATAFLSDTSKDAAVLVTLAPGTYTAQVSGVNRTTGVGLVEIYLMP